jgi:hypothetical protein
MNHKIFTAYFYSIEKLVNAEAEQIDRAQIESILTHIQSLELDRTSETTRYYDDGGDERFILFQSDYNDIPKPTRKYFIPGLFVKRRVNNYPYENDDKGHLFRIKLSDEDNKLAEATFFIIDTSLRVLLFVSNKYVGSSTSFEEYINKKKSLNNEFDDFQLSLAHIFNENPEADFAKMIDISSLELRVSGSLSALENFLSDKKDSAAETMNRLAKFAQRSRSQSIHLLFSSGRQKKEKLDKAELDNLYKQLKRYFKNSEYANKYIVKGLVDEETRFIDLLNPQYFHKTNFNYEGPYPPLGTVFKGLYSIMEQYRAKFISENKFREDKT